MITAILPQRGQDDHGSGAWGAPRGPRKHRGIDWACYPGTVLYSPIAGKVTKIGYPYGDDLSFRYVEVTDVDNRAWRFFYVEPTVKVGDVMSRHASELGTVQDIAARYPKPGRQPMTNHVHIEVRWMDGAQLRYLNPAELLDKV